MSDYFLYQKAKSLWQRRKCHLSLLILIVLVTYINFTRFIIPFTTELNVVSSKKYEFDSNFKAQTRGDNSVPFDRCPNYQSTLHISELLDGAGLGDRAIKIEYYGDLATWLCATLIVPPPSIWLNKKHNNHTKVHDDLDWSDYLETKRLSDGSSFLSTHISKRKEWSGKCHHLYSSCKVEKTLAKALKITQANECFWWDHQQSTVACKGNSKKQSFSNLMQKTVNQIDLYQPKFERFKCTGPMYIYPVVTSLALQRAASDIMPNTQKYDTLHVRSGSGRYGLIDKSVPSIIRYLHNTTAGKNILSTLIVFTDVKDEVYLNELFISLKAFNNWKQIRFGDQEIRSRYPTITKNNNFMTYAIASTIIGDSATQYATGTRVSTDSGDLVNDTYENCHPCSHDFFKGTSEDFKKFKTSCKKKMSFDFMNEQSENRIHSSQDRMIPASKPENIPTGPLIYVKAHKVGGSAMSLAIDEMGKAAAPWTKCSKFSLQECSLYGKKHRTWHEISDTGFGKFQTRYYGSVFAITARDPLDRLLSLAYMRLGGTKPSKKEKKKKLFGWKKGVNRTALDIFEDDIKENVGGTYMEYLNNLLTIPTYNYVCLLAHDGGYHTEECKDSPEHLFEKLPKAIEALGSFHVVGLTNDFATSVIMIGLTAGWDYFSLAKFGQDREEIPLTEVDFEDSKKEMPNRMCPEDMHEENKELLLQSRLFQAEIKLFQEAQRIHSTQLRLLSNKVGKEAFEEIVLEYKKKYDTNSLVQSRSCKFITMN